MRGIALLGATGSIGDSTLAVLALHPDRYRLEVAAARRNVRAHAATMCRQFAPPLAVLTDPQAATALRERLGTASDAGARRRRRHGPGGPPPGVDVVVAGIVGAAGLASTLAAARAGRRLLLANKESLVLAGALFMEAVQTGGAQLIPIDSEKNAMFQCLAGLPLRRAGGRTRRAASGAHRLGRAVSRYPGGATSRRARPSTPARTRTG